MTDPVQPDAKKLTEALWYIVELSRSPMKDESAIAKGERLNNIHEHAKELVGERPFDVSQYVSKPD